MHVIAKGRGKVVAAPTVRGFLNEGQAREAVADWLTRYPKLRERMERDRQIFVVVSRWACVGVEVQELPQKH